MAAVGQYDDTMGDGGQLFQFGGDDDERHALAAEFFDHFQDFRMCADIDAACRLVEDQKPGMGGEPAGQNGFLLIAPGQEFDRPLGVGRTDIERFDEAFGKFRFLPAGERPCPALPGLQRQRNIIGDGKVADDAVRLSFFRTESESGRYRGLGRRNRHRFSVYRRVAGIGTINAEQQKRGFRSAGAKETGDADDLAWADAEIERGDAAAFAVTFETDRGHPR